MQQVLSKWWFPPFFLSSQIKSSQFVFFVLSNYSHTESLMQPPQCTQSMDQSGEQGFKLVCLETCDWKQATSLHPRDKIPGHIAFFRYLNSHFTSPTKGLKQTIQTIPSLIMIFKFKFPQSFPFSSELAWLFFSKLSSPPAEPEVWRGSRVSG